MKNIFTWILMQEDGIDSRRWSSDVLNEYRSCYIATWKIYSDGPTRIKLVDIFLNSRSQSNRKIRISRIFLHTEEYTEALGEKLTANLLQSYVSELRERKASNKNNNRQEKFSELLKINKIKILSTMHAHQNSIYIPLFFFG